MKVFNLQCRLEHRFEGWFTSDAERQRQLAEGLLTCPLCGDAQIAVLPSAPRVQRSVSKGPLRAEPGQAEPASSVTTLQSAWMKAVQHVLANTDDVGDQFADEARRIHYGEVPERGIRGRASPEDTRALRDEGIDVVPLPIPEHLKGPLQ